MISEVAKKYAKALFEISLENKSQDKIFSDLRSLVDALASDSSINEFFSAHFVNSDTKVQIIEKSLGGKLDPSLVDVLKLMATKGRLNLIRDLSSAYEKLVDDSHGVTRGSVRSAKLLSAEARQKIEQKVAEVTKKKVILNFKEDPKLLAGMVAQVDGWTFDDSLETHLTHMGEDLNRRSH